MNHKELLEAQERAFGAGITVAAGFDLSAKSPLDTRICVKTIDERNNHVTNHRAYEGMIVYVEDTKLTYQYMGGTTWKEFGFNQEDFQKEVINDLTTGGATKALSAEQGKVLKQNLDTTNTNLNSHKSNTEIHVTKSDKDIWNAKETPSGAQTKATKAYEDAIAYAEPKIATKGTAFNKNFGTAAGTVAQGNHNHDSLYLGKTAMATDSDKVDGYHVNDTIDITKGNALWTAVKTKSEIDTAVSNLIDGAPDALNTLSELADALNDHEDAYDALLSVVDKKADKDYVDGAVNNVHTHNNKSILDATQQAFTTTLKTKLDGIATGANKYELPKATSSVLGGIKLGSGLVSDSDGVVSALMSSDEVYCMNKEEEFSATANQTLFILKNGFYMGNCGAIEVYVNGSKVPMKDVREHDSYDRVSLPTGLLEGDKVLVRYTQLSRLVGDDGHTHSNKNILDEITTDKIQHWDKGGSGAVLVSPTAPSAPTLNMLWVEFK